MSTTPTPTTVPAWTLGDRLRRALDHAGVKVKDMQADLDISHGTMSNYLSNRTRPNAATLKMWALRCGVDYHWLASGDDDRGDGPNPSSRGLDRNPTPASQHEAATPREVRDIAA